MYEYPVPASDFPASDSLRRLNVALRVSGEAILRFLLHVSRISSSLLLTLILLVPCESGLEAHPEINRERIIMRHAANFLHSIIYL
jgi:hypothetical protein